MDQSNNPLQALDKPQETGRGLADGPEKAVHVSMDGLSRLLDCFPKSTIHMDPNGDLDLAVVGDDKGLRRFRVSSAMFSRASPVWRTVLTNGFKESPIGSRPVYFPEDSVLAFFVVLLAVHLRFPEIPRQINLEQFEQICTVCNQYDCIAVLQPLLDNWKMQLNFRDKQGYHPELYKSWAWIGWTTGDETIIRRVKNYYIHRSHTNAAKKLLDEGNQILDGELPRGLLGQ